MTPDTPKLVWALPTKEADGDPGRVVKHEVWSVDCGGSSAISPHAEEWRVALSEAASGADVTVVIPAYNREPVLRRALDSVANQTVQPKHVVVIDDGSTDGTASVARDAGVTVLSHATPLGAGEARNAGIRWATTRWIAFLDSDDEWSPDHIGTVLEEVGGNIFVTTVMVDEYGRARGNTTGNSHPIRPEMLFFPENVVCTSTVVANRQALNDVGLFRSMDRAEDLDLWVRLLKRGSALALPRPTGVYHVSQAYVPSELQRRNHAGTASVLQRYAAESWMTRRLGSRVSAQMHWDALRHAQHQRAWAVFLREIAALARRPGSALSVLATMRHRRQGRSAHWLGQLALSPEQRARLELSAHSG